MKYIKRFESNDYIVYSLNDIVICSTKHDRFHDYTGIITQNGELEYDNEKEIKYCREYKVIQIYWSGRGYRNVTTNLLYNAYVDVQDIETDEIITMKDANMFTLKSEWKIPDEPMIGDYVLCEIKSNKYSDDDNIFDEYINNNIGRVTSQNEKNAYVIEYRDIPKEMIGEINQFYNDTNPIIKDLGKHEFRIKDIKLYSKSKKEVEDYLKIKKSINKFNL